MPTIVSIALSKIRPNPDNPRKVVPPEAVDKCAASMKAAGQKTPVKLRKLPDGNFMIVGGHIRWLAAKKLGWKTLEAIVVDIPAEQVLLDAILDNRDEEMTWLELYEAIEALMSRPPKKTQQQVADLLGMRQQLVSRAIQLLKLLSQAAREMIYRIPVKQGEMTPENTIFALTSLAQGKAEDDMKRAEKSLKVVLDREMTEPQVKQLVNWVKQGNSPASFPQGGAAGKAAGPRLDRSDPNYEVWKPLPEWASVKRDKEQFYDFRGKLIKFGAPYGVYCLLSGIRKFEQAVQSWENPEVRLDNPYEAKLEELFEKGIAEAKANWDQLQKAYNEKKAAKFSKKTPKIKNVLVAKPRAVKTTRPKEPKGRSGKPPFSMPGEIVSEKEMKILEDLLGK